MIIIRKKYLHFLVAIFFSNIVVLKGEVSPIYPDALFNQGIEKDSILGETVVIHLPILPAENTLLTLPKPISTDIINFRARHIIKESEIPNLKKPKEENAIVPLLPPTSTS